MENLKKLTHELDWKLGAIGNIVRTLSDIETLLGYLVEDMDQVVHKGEEESYYHEHHRRIRVLAALMFHTMLDLKENFDTTYDVKQKIFNKVVAPSAGNTLELVENL